ncbi:MAG: M1 family aminopeptidase [candidate division KSB1 bacterium]|nr:M1 family aminopeptidase [candidate division KSB1 bacterium]
MQSYRHMILAIVLSTVPTSWCQSESYWQQFVHYRIRASLDCNTHSIHAIEELEYHNLSPDTLTELFFHLYPNAFQKNSIMDREARAASVNIIQTDANLGWIKVDSIEVRDLSSNQKISFDDKIDDTILKINLNAKLLPGERLLIRMKFVTKIRQFLPAGGKGGYRGNHYEVSQWYPKICVYDKNGWNATPYHWLGEFYGEFGTFDVQLDLPASYIVGATGEVVYGDPGWRKAAIDSTGNAVSQITKISLTKAVINEAAPRRVVSFHAENVHDFVWIASPDYLYQAGKWNDVPIHILFQKSSKQVWYNTALTRAQQALTWLNDTIGKYPYPQLTLVEGVLFGGMEYPMVAVLGDVDLTLILHEICHNYFYGALANNEAKEGWLDEGLVTFLSDRLVRENAPRYMAKTTPSIPIRAAFIRNQFGQVSLDDIKLNSIYYYLYSGHQQPLSTPPWKLGNLFLYSYNIYAKPARIFAMLEYLLGRDGFDRMLKQYYQQWKFKHVDRFALQKVCEQISGQDLSWFFHQWIDQTKRIDYAITEVTTAKSGDGSWRTEFLIKRLGSGNMPIELMVVTELGDTLRQRWQNEQQNSTIFFNTHSKITDFQLDPGDVILDQNRLNNGRFTIKHYLYPDFPSMYYLPRDAYSAFWWPQLWYNNIDGAKIGVKLYGGYLNRYYVVRSRLWYGVRSKQVDFEIGYTMPWEWINENWWRHVYLIRAEGRAQLSLSANYVKSREIAGLENLNIKFGFAHQHVFDERYTDRIVLWDDQTIHVPEWDMGSINKFFFSYSNSTNPKNFPQYQYSVRAQISDQLWGSDFNYYRLAFEHQVVMGSIRSNRKLNVRNFLGFAISSQHRVPLQEQFGIAEANASQRFEHYYLSSPGSKPYWMALYLPGDGNLRGYFNKLIAGNQSLTSERIAAVNFELIQRNFQQLFPHQIKTLVQGIDLCLFFDVGRIWDVRLEHDFLMDAGIGWRFYQMIFGKQRTLRLELPLWLSRPRIDRFHPPESRWKFRWIISFE